MPWKRSNSLGLAICNFSPNDYIVRDGEMAFEMYFIKKGSAHVVSANGIILVKLESGSYFGESALLARQPRMASVRAVEYCETCAIVKDDFDEILYEFPQERQIIIVAVGEELRRKKRFNSVDRNLSRTGSTKVRRMSAALKHSDLSVESEERTKIQDFFLPHGGFRAFWSLISFLGLLYAVVVAPVRSCMSDLEPLPRSLFFVDIFFEAFFLLDILFRFTIFSYVYEGTVVQNMEQISMQYLRTNFPLDLVISVPYSFIIRYFGMEKTRLVGLELIKILRYVRCNIYWKRIDTYMRRFNLDISGQMQLLGFVFINYVGVIHSCACIWILLHRFLQAGRKKTWAIMVRPAIERILHRFSAISPLLMSTRTHILHIFTGPHRSRLR